MSGCAENRSRKISGTREERKEGRKEGRRWRCEKEAEEERDDPNACEMKRIKGLRTSRRGRKTCGGRRMSD